MREEGVYMVSVAVGLKCKCRVGVTVLTRVI